jgi:hypothetical protein
MRMVLRDSQVALSLQVLKFICGYERMVLECKFHMRKLIELVDQPLEWVQPRALRMQYELRASDELVATLHFRSSLGSFATGDSADGCWTFKRVGFWQTRVTIRLCGGDSDIASFQNNTWSGGGSLELSDGRVFHATTNLWQTRLEFQNESNSTLIQFRSGGVLHQSAKVEIQPSAVGTPELPFMMILGWYLIVMMSADSAMVGSIAAAT